MDGVTTTNISATSGGAGGASYPGPGDTLTLDAASGGGVVTLGADLNVQSLTMGAFTGTFNSSTFAVTLQTFSCSGTGTRTLNMGSGQWTITGNATTVWDITTITNLTFTKGSLPVIFNYSGSSGTRTIINGAITPFQLSSAIDVSITAGTDALSITNTRLGHLIFTGFNGTLQGGTRVIYGNLTISSGMTWLSGTPITTFAGTSGTQTITTNGVALNSPLTIDGVGANVVLADSLNMSGASDRTLTLTNGTFDASGFNVTCGLFSSSNANIRTLTMGSGTWTLTGSGATIWTTNTSTNMTLNTGGDIVCNYAGSTGTRALAMTKLVGNIRVTAGSDICSVSGIICNNLDLTGFTGTFAGASSLNVAGNFDIGTATASTFTGTTTFSATSGTKTIRTNGITLNAPITFNGVGGTWTLSDNLTIGSTRTLTLTNGTFNANNKNVSCGLFASSNSNTRVLTMGSGTWTITGTGTVWSFATVTGLTYNVGTSTVIISDTSASSKTIASPSSPVAFYNLTIIGGGSGAIIWTGVASRAINTLTITGPKTIQWSAGGTYVVADWNVQGSSGNNVVFNSTTPGSTYTFSKASGLVDVRYVTIQDSIATGGAYFQATNSTDSGNNSGWNFVTASAGGGLSAGKKFARFGGSRAINEVMDSKLHGYRKLGG